MMRGKHAPLWEGGILSLPTEEAPEGVTLLFLSHLDNSTATYMMDKRRSENEGTRREWGKGEEKICEPLHIGSLLRMSKNPVPFFPSHKLLFSLVYSIGEIPSLKYHVVFTFRITKTYDRILHILLCSFLFIEFAHLFRWSLRQGCWQSWDQH